jgi:hypothetical protein
MRGMHRMNGETRRVPTPEDRKADRRRSFRLWLLTGALTLACTGLAVVFPYP